jgi:hypothetical protein
MTISPALPDLSREVPDSDLLIKEAQRASRRRRMRNAVIVLGALVVMSAIIVTRTTSKVPSTPPPKTTVANFLESMRHANDTRFMATYRVSSYVLFSNGVITMAQIPSPPGTKAIPNSDGYAHTGRYAYLYRGSEGRITQWIKIGSNVSGCETPTLGRKGPMTCSRLSPYLPSNGFAEADLGFVPTYVLQAMHNFAPQGLVTNVNFTTRFSDQFVRLTCLTQALASASQTTCIDRPGYVVLWSYHSNGHSSSVILTSFNPHPTAKDFRTLVKPTQSLVLPVP